MGTDYYIPDNYFCPICKGTATKIQGLQPRFRQRYKDNSKYYCNDCNKIFAIKCLS